MISNKLTKYFYSDFTINMAANLFSYFVAFCGPVVYARMLGINQYGLYTFAFNIISLFLLFNGFGAASGILQFVSSHHNEPDKQDAYLHFAFKSGVLFNALMGCLILIYATYFQLPIPKAKPILIAMALFPIGRLYIDIFQAFLRAKQQNKEQVIFSLTNNLAILILNILGVYFFKLYGLIIFNYLAYFIVFIICIKYYNLPNPIFKPKTKANILHKQFLNYSFFTTLSNAFSGLLFTLDIIIIGYVLKDPKLVASYRVATIIPFALNFIPNIVMNYYYPDFVKNGNQVSKIKKLAYTLCSRMLIFSGIISLTLVIFGKTIILTIFGSQYSNSILPFQIISSGFFIIASFRSINGSIIASLGKAKISTGITTIILCLNIVITYFMVIHYSIIGAAIAIVIMYSISSLIGYITLKIILKKMQHE